MAQNFKKIINFLKKYEFISFEKNKKSLIALIILLLTGMIIGAVSVHEINLEIIHKIDFLFLNNFKEKILQSGVDIFISSLSNLFLIIILIEISALSLWGILLIPAIIFFRGFSLGLTSGYLYLIYGLKGIAFYILIMLPGIFVSAISILLFGTESFDFSVKYAKKLLPHPSEENLFKLFLSQLKRSRCSIILLPISALLDTCFMAMFSRFFEF